MTSADLAALLRPRLRAGVANELAMQDQVARALVSLGLEHQRERALSPRDRPDFMVGGLAVEVKVSGSGTAVLAQVLRYLEHDHVTGAVLVTTRTRHWAPEEAHGKPIALIYVTMLGIH